MLKLVPLGGLGEIGLNAMLLEAQGERVLIDCGLMFPHGDFPGVEVFVPDFTALTEGAAKLKAVVLTHAHEDHVGALPWLLKKQPVPIYGTRFTLALVRHRLDELSIRADLRVFEPRERVKLCPAFTVEPIRVTHSVPDAVGLIFDTPHGRLVHTGDFKLDGAPIDGQLTDLHRLGEAGEQGVDLLLSDSTNAEVPGTTGSEHAVVETLERLITPYPGRVVVTLFGSHLHRVHFLLGLAEKLGRKVLLAGRSLQRNVSLARELGYLKVNDELLIDFGALSMVPKQQTLVIATGAQGEPRSALWQMLSATPGDLRIEPGDLLLFSSRTIPGNATSVATLIDTALSRGAKVLYPAIERGLHASGHAANDEQRKMIEVVKPRGFIPIHGELKHLHRHSQLAREARVPQVLLATDGDVVGVNGEGLSSLGRVAHGRAAFRREGDAAISQEAIDERRLIAAAGVVFVSVIIDMRNGTLLDGPRITSRGLGADESAAVQVAADGAKQALAEISTQKLLGDEVLVRDTLVSIVRRAFKQLTGSRPAVVPVVLKTR